MTEIIERVAEFVDGTSLLLERGLRYDVGDPSGIIGEVEELVDRAQLLLDRWYRGK